MDDERGGGRYLTRCIDGDRSGNVRGLMGDDEWVRQIVFSTGYSAVLIQDGAFETSWVEKDAWNESRLIREILRF